MKQSEDERFLSRGSILLSKVAIAFRVGSPAEMLWLVRLEHAAVVADTGFCGPARPSCTQATVMLET